MRGRAKVLSRLGPGAGAVVAFLLILAAGSLLSPSFLTARNLSNLLVQSSTLGIVAVGMTFVILAAGIDLSVGTVFSLSSVVAALSFENGRGLPVAGVAATALLVGVGAGALNASVIIWRKAAPFVVTLATMAIASGTALTVSGGRPIGGIDRAYAWIGSGSVGPVPVLVVIMLCVFAAGSFTLRSTPFGRYVYAVGGNEEAARLSGVRVGQVKLGAYVISGALAALGGFLFSARVTVGDPWAGRGMELDAVAAVVLGGASLFGGIGNLWGTLLGTLMIAMINNLLNLLNVSPHMQGIAKGLIILIAVTAYKKPEN
jgi:ribose/xylose/arabinose/galactoside ABC-type transport system permease subunit